MKDTPPLHFFAGIILEVALWWALPWANRLAWPWIAPGLALIGVGAYLNVAAELAFRRNKTSHKFRPSKALVADGPFRFTRNPMYLGLTAILLGLALCLRSVAALVAPAVFFAIMNLRFIPYEERKTTADLGEAYTEYRRRVRRWL